MGNPVDSAIGGVVGFLAGGPAGALAGLSVSESRNARKEEREARRIQERANRLKSRRAALNQVKEAQILRAEIINAGEGAGVGSSSAVAGGAGAVQSTAGGNVGFQQQLFTLQSNASRRLQKASESQFNAGLLGQAAGIAGSIE